MINIIFNLFVRVARRERPPLNYTELNNNQIPEFIKKNPNCVIFYSENHKVIKPLKMTLDEHSDITSFALTTPNPNENLYCIGFPCASAYLNGTHVRSTISDLSPLDFQFWVSHTISEPHFDIAHAEELRRLLNLPGFHLISVDIPHRPIWVPQNLVVFYTTTSHFNRIGVTVSSGFYVFRHGDRELIKLSRWDPMAFNSLLFDIGYDNIKQRPFLGGTFIDHYSDESDKERIDALRNVAPMFNKLFSLATFSDSLAGHISHLAKVSSICGPLFLILNTSSFRGPHWGFTSVDKVNSPLYIQEFLSKIQKGLQPNRISLTPSNKIRSHGVIEVVTDNYNQLVFNHGNASIVIITSSCYDLPDEFPAVMNAASWLYHYKGVKFFAFDQGRNENPLDLPIFLSYPQIIIYPKGFDNRNFELFTKELTLPNFVEFVKINSGLNITLTPKEEEAFQHNVMENMKRFEENRMNQQQGYNNGEL